MNVPTFSYTLLKAYFPTHQEELPLIWLAVNLGPKPFQTLSPFSAKAMHERHRLSLDQMGADLG